MKIEELPSGSYRIRKMYKGKTYTVVVDYKPTQKEAAILLAEALQDIKDKGTTRTFEACADEYISVKSNILSPSTITGYRRYMKWLTPAFSNMNIYDIDGIRIQAEINSFAVNHSPKSTRNLHGFISAVLRMFRPNMNISTTLPQKQKKEPYIPEDEAVKMLLDDSVGTKWEVPIRLACYGMRRSEICALDISDLNGNYLTVNKAMVLNPNNEYVIKNNTKTSESTRIVYIDDDLAELIRKQGYIFDGLPCSITDYMSRFQKKTGIKGFSLHKLRHYYATFLHDKGVPDSDIMKLGGWSSDYVMKNVYRHSMQNTLVKAQGEIINHLKNLS